MSSESATATAAGDDDIIFDLLTLIRVYRSGRVERFEPTEFLPPSFDQTTGVDSKDITINPSTDLAARLYLPSSTTKMDGKLPVVIFYHGGGFCVHRAASAHYHNYLNHLTAKAKILAVSIDYRLAPEHPIPAAYDDSWEALRWVAQLQHSEAWLSKFGDLDKIFLAGDSAGANIVHNLGMRLGKEGKKVEGMVLMNPFFWGKERIGWEGEEREGVTIKAEVADGLWPFLCPESIAGNDDPMLNPWAEGAMSLAGLGCGRVLVTVGEKDLLLDRARVYTEKVKESGWGGAIELVVAEGENHGFFLSYPGNKKAEAFMERFVGYCNN
ncbi:probable carboxylesterase 2 [Dendrobium catenatum]|uniref:Putative carboxylesterase 2 n=1 Tax=Dendrobium catenatum TaxID=906689 RepID=A0A2I0W0D2_9ASPA|nr:probable carboxylesterase 2 [Dendrobium catenatum]PKU69123.1 putative carboxylesterase 2 [Dendrobium catenatum]